MLNNKANVSDFTTFREYFNNVYYSFVDEFALMEQEKSFFPNFTKLQQKIHRLNLPQLFAFSVFRQGHPVDQHKIDQFLSPEVFESMQNLGVLRKHKDQWKTPGISIVPFQGIYAAIPLPDIYPTSQYRFQSLPYDIKYFTSLISPRQHQQVLDISSNGYGVTSMFFSKNNNVNITICHQNSGIDNLIEFNLLLNNLSDSVELSQLKVGLKPYDIVYGKIDSTNESLLEDLPIDEPLAYIRNIISSTKLTKDGKYVFIVDTIDDDNEAPKLRDLAESVSLEFGLRSNVLILGKYPLDVYFDTLFRTSMPDWNLVAGFKSQTYLTKRDAWLSSINIQDFTFKKVYKTIWVLSKHESQKIQTLYKAWNTDLLYAFSSISTNIN